MASCPTSPVGPVPPIPIPNRHLVPSYPPWTPCSPGPPGPRRLAPLLLCCSKAKFGSLSRRVKVVGYSCVHSPAKTSTLLPPYLILARFSHSLPAVPTESSCPVSLHRLPFLSSYATSLLPACAGSRGRAANSGSAEIRPGLSQGAQSSEMYSLLITTSHSPSPAAIKLSQVLPVLPSTPT